MYCNHSILRSLRLQPVASHKECSYISITMMLHYTNMVYQEKWFNASFTKKEDFSIYVKFSTSFYAFVTYLKYVLRQETRIGIRKHSTKCNKSFSDLYRFFDRLMRFQYNGSLPITLVEIIPKNDLVMLPDIFFYLQSPWEHHAVLFNRLQNQEVFILRNLFIVFYVQW